MAGKQHNPQPQRYKFRIRGHVGGLTLRAFPEMEAETYGADTLLTGHLPDPVALYGVVAQIERLGLELLEIGRPPGTKSEPRTAPWPRTHKRPR